MKTVRLVLVQGKEPKSLEITQEMRPYEMRIAFRFNGRELGRIENKERLREEIELKKEFTLDDGSLLTVAGYLVPKTRDYVFDAFLNGRLVPGSSSYPQSYPVPILLLGVCHLASGFSRGVVPVGGCLQAWGSDLGSIVLGAVFLLLGAAAARNSARAFKTAFALVLIDGGLSLWVLLRGASLPGRAPSLAAALFIALVLIALPIHLFHEWTVSNRLKRVGLSRAV